MSEKQPLTVDLTQKDDNQPLKHQKVSRGIVSLMR
jgi:hypothetical protein